MNMSNCKQITRLLSDALDRALGAEEAGRVKKHLAICPACENCRQNFLKLRIWRDAVHGEPASRAPHRS